MTAYSVLGTRVTREDGPDKVSGQHLYSADVILPGMVWGKVLRSPYPHAKILHIDTSLAERLTGVRAVITGNDTRGMRVGRFMRDVPPLAEDKVRFVGEKVAAVAADDPDTAEEALNLIRGGVRPTSRSLRPTRSHAIRRAHHPRRLAYIRLIVGSGPTPGQHCLPQRVVGR